jgi:hypothetical protein
MPLNFGQLSYNQEKPKEYGLPLEVIEKVTNELQQRYFTNLGTKDQLQVMQANIDTLDKDKPNIKAAIDRTNATLNPIIQSGDWSSATMLVNSAARDFAKDQNVRLSVEDYAKAQAHGAELKKLLENKTISKWDYDTALNKTAAENHLPVSVDPKTGTVSNSFHGVIPAPYVPIHEKLDTIVRDIKPDTYLENLKKYPGLEGYLSYGKTSVTDPNKVRAAALEYLMNDPMAASYIQWQNEAETFNKFGRAGNDFVYDDKGNLNYSWVSAKDFKEVGLNVDPNNGNIFVGKGKDLQVLANLTDDPEKLKNLWSKANLNIIYKSDVNYALTKMQPGEKDMHYIEDWKAKDEHQRGANASENVKAMLFSNKSISTPITPKTTDSIKEVIVGTTATINNINTQLANKNLDKTIYDNLVEQKRTLETQQRNAKSAILAIQSKFTTNDHIKVSEALIDDYTNTLNNNQVDSPLISKLKSIKNDPNKHSKYSSTLVGYADLYLSNISYNTDRNTGENIVVNKNGNKFSKEVALVIATDPNTKQDFEKFKTDNIGNIKSEYYKAYNRGLENLNIQKMPTLEKRFDVAFSGKDSPVEVINSFYNNTLGDGTEFLDYQSGKTISQELKGTKFSVYKDSKNSNADLFKSAADLTKSELNVTLNAGNGKSVFQLKLKDKEGKQLYNSDGTEAIKLVTAADNGKASDALWIVGNEYYEAGKFRKDDKMQQDGLRVMANANLAELSTVEPMQMLVNQVTEVPTNRGTFFIQKTGELNDGTPMLRVTGIRDHRIMSGTTGGQELNTAFGEADYSKFQLTQPNGNDVFTKMEDVMYAIEYGVVQPNAKVKVPTKDLVVNQNSN